MNDNKVKNLVITAFFTAITFLGIQSFRIPLPAAVGTPFLHFGHIFVVMGLLLQGGKRGAVSGTLGLTIFDMLNGYMQDAPKTFVETAVKCLIVGALFMMLKKKADGDYEHDRNDDGRKWICSSCSGSIHITSGDCDQCSIYGDRNCDSVSAGEKDLCAHGIEGDITDFFLWKLADTYDLKWCICLLRF